MPVEIACGNCGNAFGVETGWAGLIVQCPHCQAAVQVPDEVAQYAAAPPDDEQDSTVSQVSLSECRNGDPVNQRIGPTAPDFPALAERPEPAASSRGRWKDTRTPAAKAGTNSKRSPAPPTPVPPGRPGDSPGEVAKSGTNAADGDAPSTAGPLEVLPPRSVPPLSVPPACPWLIDSPASVSPKIVVAEGLTTINYQGRKVVLREQPEAAHWYGLSAFVGSIVTLVVLLTWLYFLYR
jgi:hypothetical protein